MQRLETIYSLDVDAILNGRPFHFIVIGAGGTGGYYIPQVARQISVMNTVRKPPHLHQITVCDADDVEMKNLIRQNFITRDIGQNKAEVLAMRYSTAFGIQIGVKASYVESEAALIKLMDLHPNSVPVVVGCVDNNKTRQMIAQLFYSRKKNFFWLDSGNEEYAGQAIIGWNGSDKLPDLKKGATPQLFYMPCITDVFPDIMADTGTKFVTEMSCAERAVSAPQSMGVNSTAASQLFNISNILLNSKPMGGLRTNGVTFNVKNNSYGSRHNKMENLQARYVAETKATPLAAG